MTYRHIEVAFVMPCGASSSYSTNKRAADHPHTRYLLTIHTLHARPAPPQHVAAASDRKYLRLHAIPAPMTASTPRDAAKTNSKYRLAAYPTRQSGTSSRSDATLLPQATRQHSTAASQKGQRPSRPLVYLPVSDNPHRGLIDSMSLSLNIWLFSILPRYI